MCSATGSRFEDFFAALLLEVAKDTDWRLTPGANVDESGGFWCVEACRATDDETSLDPNACVWLTTDRSGDLAHMAGNDTKPERHVRISTEDGYRYAIEGGIAGGREPDCQEFGRADALARRVWGELKSLAPQQEGG